MTSTALALNQEKRRVVARALLKQHGLTEWVEDYDAFGLRRHQDAAAFWQKPRIIDSIAAARGRNMPTTCAHHFDVIVDEAHHLRDRTSRSWQLSFRQTRSIVFMPPIYDWSTSGTAIVPSACWLHWYRPRLSHCSEQGGARDGFVRNPSRLATSRRRKA